MTRNLVITVAALLLLALPVRAERRTGPLPARPGRLIVKYTHAVDVCAHCLIESGQTFASITGSPSLDRRNASLGVRSARPLFLHLHGLGKRDRRTAYLDLLASARSRFPVRAAHAPSGSAAPDLSNVYLLELAPGVDLQAAAAFYEADPDVVYAEPDYRRSITLLPNDPFLSSSGSWGQSYADLWGMHQTLAPAAWDVSIGGGVVVAIVDTGVDLGHPDLAPNAWTNPAEIAGNGEDDDGNGFVDDVVGWDFANGDADPQDDHGHGTHVAGTAAAAGNDGYGVAGMAWGARIMALKGLNKDGSGSDADLAPAIVYAAVNGADVVNMSWGGGGASQTLKDALVTAANLGTVLVAAAGNSGYDVQFHFPSNQPETIAVAASDAGDGIASFSNWGDAISVAAPGVDILSSRASQDKIGTASTRLAPQHLRLSGTSMATPHVAGLAAVLLAAQPGLTPDEVRWHIELNADQLGYPGWEGERWNPYYGYGRIDAARVFDPPPVTTRLKSLRQSKHRFAGSVTPAATSFRLAFTSLLSVPWTLTSPPWFIPDAAAGAGDADINLTLDTTSLVPGSYQGTLVVDAPAAADGGGSLSLPLEVHRDERLGPAVAYTESPQRGPPAIASNGLDTVVVFEDAASFGVGSLYVDPQGNVVPKASLGPGFPHPASARIASDGHNFLAMWHEEFYENHDYLWSALLGPTGEAIGSPTLVKKRRSTSAAGIYLYDVAFDGESFIALWADINVRSDTERVYFQRIGVDGSVLGRRRRFLPDLQAQGRQFYDPAIACNQGQCLIAWSELDNDVDPVAGRRLIRFYGIRIAGDEILDERPILIMDEGYGVAGVSADGAGYLVVGSRWLLCDDVVPPQWRYCGWDALAARVAADGSALDYPGGILVTNPQPMPNDDVRLAFDVDWNGSEHVILFSNEGAFFATNVRPDGTVDNDESPGLLAVERGHEIQSWIRNAATRTHSVLAWTSFGLEGPNDLRVQRIFPHQPWPRYPEFAIGTIGPKVVAERELLRLIVTAPALDPSSVVFQAANLPEGARFDPSSGVFQWIPPGDASGSDPVITFSAEDGNLVVSEDVPLTVTEARLTLTGSARLADGTAVPGVAVRLRGSRVRRSAATDLAGRFRFENLAPGRFRLTLDKLSRKLYRAHASRVSVVDSDVSADLSLEAK